MKARCISLTVILCSFAFAGAAFAQEPKTACELTAPPKYVLLVHQEFRAGKTAAGKKEEAVAWLRQE